jgi:hypothetical protein
MRCKGSVASSENGSEEVVLPSGASEMDLIYARLDQGPTGRT